MVNLSSNVTHLICCIGTFIRRNVETRVYGRWKEVHWNVCFINHPENSYQSKHALYSEAGKRHNLDFASTICSTGKAAACRNWNSNSNFDPIAHCTGITWLILPTPSIHYLQVFNVELFHVMVDRCQNKKSKCSVKLWLFVEIHVFASTEKSKTFAKLTHISQYFERNWRLYTIISIQNKHILFRIELCISNKISSIK